MGAESTTETYRNLVRRTIDGREPVGEDFDACRQVLRAGPEADTAFQAMCHLLEGLLAVPTLDIDDTRDLVHLLKDPARAKIAPGDLL